MFNSSSSVGDRTGGSEYAATVTPAGRILSLEYFVGWGGPPVVQLAKRASRSSEPTFRAESWHWCPVCKVSLCLERDQLTCLMLSFVKSKAVVSLVKGLSRCTLFWLKYLDYLVLNKPGTLDGASGFYFLGRKSDTALSDRALIGLYKGVLQ